MRDVPQDLIAEMATLGSMLISSNAICEVVENVKADDFYRPAHEQVFRVIVDLWTAGRGVDAVTVADDLQQRGKLRNVGGPQYLYELTQVPPGAINAAQYAKIVRDKAVRRRLISCGNRFQELGFGDCEQVEEVLSQAEAFLREVRTPPEKAADFDSLILEWNAWVGADATEDVMPTPWFKVNEILSGGLHKGKTYIFGGRPGQGKSISGLNIAAHAAENGKTVLIFSLEMPRTEVASRLLSAGAQVQFQRLARRLMDDDTVSAVQHYAAVNAGMRLYVVDKASMTVEQIVAHCRSVKNLDLVFIDYAQLVAATDSRVSRDQQVAHVSRTLKVLAKDLNVVVVLAAQLNRQLIDPKTGKARVPSLSDLRESGSLEADADAVLFLHRPDEDDGTVDIVVAKNRSGLTGMVPLIFFGNQARLG